MSPKPRSNESLFDTQPTRVRVRKTTRVSTSSGMLVFREHQLYTDATLIALIVKNKVPYRIAEPEDD